MKHIVIVIAMAILMLSATAQAHEGHKHPVKAYASGNFSCSQWASFDPAHPNAPGSYKSYGCSNTDGDWAWVVGTGYSGTMHVSKLHRVCVKPHWYGCEGYLVYNEQHTHS